MGPKLMMYAFVPLLNLETRSIFILFYFQKMHPYCTRVNFINTSMASNSAYFIDQYTYLSTILPSFLIFPLPLLSA